MSGYSAKSLDELPSLWDGFAHLVRPGLEITAFGANIMNLPPNYSTKSHDESESGQQELYVALLGSGSVDIVTRSCPWTPSTSSRSTRGRLERCPRGPMGCGVPCVGGVPGGVYEAPEWSSSGE